MRENWEQVSQHLQIPFLGHFGLVTKARLRPDERDYDMEVACKRLRKADTEEALVDFVREAMTMQSLKFVPLEKERFQTQERRQHHRRLL